MLLKNVMQLASPSGGRGRLLVLIFHRVLSQPDPIFPEEMHARRFDEICRWLKSWFHVLPLATAANQLSQGTLPARAACITFDDGYADNHDVAMPILQRHDLTATFFVATGFLDGGCMWNDKVVEAIRGCRENNLDLGKWGLFQLESPAAKANAIDVILHKIKYLPTDERLSIAEHVALVADSRAPENLMMESSQVNALRDGGMQIGAHTVSHPILASLSNEAARAEIQGGKLALEHLLGEQVELFAYPNGKPGTDYTAATVAMAREAGFAAAVSTAWGAAHCGADVFQIPRFTPWDRSRLRFGGRILRNYFR